MWVLDVPPSSQVGQSPFGGFFGGRQNASRRRKPLVGRQSQRLVWGKSKRAKKDLWDSHPPEVLNPRLSTHSPSSRCSFARSGRTVRRSREDRSWFGRPQAIKKAAGSAARNKGTNASKTLGLPAAPPSSGSQWCRGCRLRTAKKKERSHPLPVRRIVPSPKGTKTR